MKAVTDVAQLFIPSGYWYLATPYTNYKDGIEAAYMGAWDISDMLRNSFVKNFSPIVFTHEIAMATGIDPLDRVFWMDADWPYMTRAHGLIVGGMDGWDESAGVAEELTYFASREKPYVFLDPNRFWGMSS